MLAVAGAADAAAIRVNPGFDANTVPRNDDSFVGPVGLGFSIDFYGLPFSTAFVNNNGNITFDAGLSTFTPFNLTTTGRQIIAPFFADVDTRSAGRPVRYGQDTVDGRPAFGVNWIDVDYFSSSTAHTNRNSFQLVLIDRSDINPGDFDFEFNYDQIQWRLARRAAVTPVVAAGTRPVPASRTAPVCRARRSSSRARRSTAPSWTVVRMR